jgi:hypothetical protein
MQDNLKYKAYKMLYEFIQCREQSIQNFKYFKGMDLDTPLPLHEVPWVSTWIRYANADLLNRQFGAPNSEYWAKRPKCEYEKVKRELEERAVFKVSP